MSKNFELLQQVGGQQEIYDTSKQERPTIAVDSTAPGTIAVGTTALEPTGMARDEITKLVHRLFLIPGTSAPHTVVFAGTETGNGCSWLAARVAEILASQVTGSVCLLDCNLRSPSLHQQFGLENHFGLSEALSQNSRISAAVGPGFRVNFARRWRELRRCSAVKPRSGRKGGVVQRSPYPLRDRGPSHGLDAG